MLTWVCYYQISRCVCGALRLDWSWLRLWGRLLVRVDQTGVIHERLWCSSCLCLISINGFTPPHVSTRTYLCRLMLFAPRSHVCRRGCSRTSDSQWGRQVVWQGGSINPTFHHAEVTVWARLDHPTLAACRSHIQTCFWGEKKIDLSKELFNDKLKYFMQINCDNHRFHWKKKAFFYF